MNFDVSATVSGNTANQVAAQIMAAAFAYGIDLQGLEVVQVGLSEPSVGEAEVLQFPHVRALMEQLRGDSA